MHLARAAHDARRAGLVGLGVGAALLTAGIVGVGGRLGIGLRLVGVVWFLAAFVDCRIRSMVLQAHGAGYRRGRRVALPVVIPGSPAGEDQQQVSAIR